MTTNAAHETETTQPERSLVLVKPDGYRRGLSGEVLARIEAKGYALVDIRLVEPDRDTLTDRIANPSKGVRVLEVRIERSAERPLHERLAEVARHALAELD